MTTIVHDESLDIYRDSVRKFFEEFATDEHIDRWREAGQVDRDLWIKAGEYGLLCPSMPEHVGGAGGDFRHEVIVLEEMGRRGIEGFGVSVHSGIVAPYILELATEARRQAWLPKIISGKIVLGIAMTEPAAGSDLRGIRTTAKRQDGGFVINGQKTFISNGQQADLIVVACKTGEKDGRAQLSLIAVEPHEADGFQRGRNLKKMGREAQDTSELFFDDVWVPEENLLGSEHEGFNELVRFLPQERLVIATMGLAMMERAIEETLSYVRDRKAFGRSLFDFQNTQFRLAECATKADIARVYLDHCSTLHLTGDLDAVTAAKAKLWITETECEVIDQCLQLFGGYGYMDEYPISRLYRDSRIDRVHGGASEIMKMIIAKSL